MEGRLNRKLILTIVKYSPWLLGLAYLVQIVLACFGVQSLIITTLFGVSFVPTLLLIMFSIFLGFCFWNRFPLYYIFGTNIINLIDFYFGIPVTTKWMLITYLLLAGILVLIGCIMKNKQHVEERNLKEKSVSNSK